MAVRGHGLHPRQRGDEARRRDPGRRLPIQRSNHVLLSPRRDIRYPPSKWSRSISIRSRSVRSSVEVGIVGDARRCSKILWPACENRARQRDYRQSEYFAELQDLKAQWEDRLRPMRTTDSPSHDHSRALVELREALPREAILVTDSSNPANQAFQRVPIYAPKDQHRRRGNVAESASASPPRSALHSERRHAGAGARRRRQLPPDRDGTRRCSDARPAAGCGRSQQRRYGRRSRTCRSISSGDRTLITDFRSATARSTSRTSPILRDPSAAPAERVEDPGQLGDAVARGFATNGPAVIEAMSAPASCRGAQCTRPAGGTSPSRPTSGIPALTTSRSVAFERRGPRTDR